MRSARLAVAVMSALALAACSASTDDFASEAEKFIEQDDGPIARSTQQTFSDAQCADPTSTDVGTTFQCTATRADGTTAYFLAEIVGKREVQVGPQDPAAATPITTPASIAATPTTTG